MLTGKCDGESLLTDLSDCNESFKSVSLSFLCILLIFLACLTNLCNKELDIKYNISKYILSVNVKLPVSKFRYFGKYIIQLYGYFYVHVSGQRQTGFER